MNERLRYVNVITIIAQPFIHFFILSFIPSAFSSFIPSFFPSLHSALDIVNYKS